MKNASLLSKAEMKKVMGGNVPPPPEDDRCVASYFFSGPGGCGTYVCNGYNSDGSCNCVKTTYPPPCDYA